MRRRTLITGFAGLVPALGIRRLFAKPASTGGGPARTCKLTTQDVTGPYHVDEYPVRSDIREGQAGVPLTLDFEVFNAMTCNPVPGALVSIWHANSQGLYSGVENLVLTEDLEPAGGMVDLRSEAFLRGMQQTDAEGRVRFQTIFPGWYFPRHPHIHVRISPPDFGEVATTQLYLLNEYCDAVYARAPYSQRGPNPMRTEPGREDPLFASEAGDLWLELRQSGEGFTASHRLGVVFYDETFGELTDFYRQS